MMPIKKYSDNIDYVYRWCSYLGYEKIRNFDLFGKMDF